MVSQFTSVGDDGAAGSVWEVVYTTASLLWIALDARAPATPWPPALEMSFRSRADGVAFQRVADPYNC